MPAESTITPWYRKPRAALSAIQSANARLGRSYLGKSLQYGAMESFGFSLKGPMFGVQGVENLGFLGTGMGAPGGFGGARSAVRAGIAKNLLEERAKAGKAFKPGSMTKRTARKFIGRGFSGAFSLAMTGLFAYEGYQEGGWVGAAGGVAESIAWSAGIRAVGGVIGGSTMAPLIIGATAASIAYAVGEAGIAHHKKLKDLELYGSPEMLGSIYSVGAATMRQRSLLALQNTHINARMAMGNEGLMIHQPFR